MVSQKEIKLILLNKSHKLVKVNVIKQQNTVLIHIANDIKTTTMRAFIYIAT